MLQLHSSKMSYNEQKILNFILFNNLAFFPCLALFRRSLTFFSKGVWQACGCQHPYSQRQKLLYGFQSKWQVHH